MFTVVIVMQASLGGTLSAAIERMKGTVLGALVGGAAAALHPQTAWGLGLALAAAVAITSLVAALWPNLKVAPVTAVIMLISPTVGGGALETALLRVVEIGVGSVIAVLATVLIFPARSNAVVAGKVGEALGQMATLVDRFADSMGASPDSAWDDDLRAIRTSLTAVEAAMADATAERSSRLADHRISEGVPRTLWRVRNDCSAAARALAPLPRSVEAVIDAEMRALVRSQAAFMRLCAQALLLEKLVDRSVRHGCLEAFEAAFSRLREEKVLQPLSFDAVGHVYALAFALESLHRNLGDLADRIDETARGAP